ncbi:MAG: hypothetical protein OEV40_05255 [Acidimicrobiia bacterium]|nr:hypothetical protein [Acidimicrobiia bacterium]
MSEKVDDIRDRLDTISEELADLSMEALRQAIDDGANKRPASEKIYSQARRAVEKASRLLESFEVNPDPDA